MAIDPDLVGENRARRRLGNRGRTPPCPRISARLIVAPIELCGFGGSASDATRAFGERAVERVVDEHFEAVGDLTRLGP